MPLNQVKGALLIMNWSMLKRYCSWLRNVEVLLGMLFVALPLAARTVRVYVDYEIPSTASGPSVSHGVIDVIDPVTHKVVQKIKGIDCAYAIEFSPDGRRVYVSSECEKVLAVVDQKTGAIIKKVPLSGSPNLILVTKDGKWVIVGIAEAPGALEFIDTNSLERVKSIPLKDGVHDIYFTPDSKYVVGGGKRGLRGLIVVDLETQQPVWEINFATHLNTLAIEANPDGSTRRIFVMRHGLRGFDVVDF